MTDYLEVVTVGDVHLDGLNSLFPTEGIALQLGAVKRTLEYAATKGVEHVVFLGDVANKPILSEDGRVALFKLLREYRDAFDTHIILGNHDIHSDGYHSLRTLEAMCQEELLGRTQIYTKPTQRILNGVTVNFLPFPQNVVIPSEAVSLNFAHVERKGALRDNGCRVTSGTEPSEKDYWVIGHLHMQQQVNDYTFFPGTLYQMSFGEPLPKGFMHLRAKASKSGNKLAFKSSWKEITPPYTLRNLEIESLSDLDAVKDGKYDLFKLFVAQHVALPQSFLAEHPNVVNVVGFRNEAELKQLMTLSASADTDMSFDIRGDLDTYLTEKMGARPKQVRRANALLDKILEQLNA